MNSTGPGGNLGYAGSPESHCVHNAIATATNPPAVSFVRNVSLVFISMLLSPCDPAGHATALAVSSAFVRCSGVSTVA